MRLLLVLAALAAAFPAAAQTVYRYVTPEGRVIFSDTPVPGARLDRTIAPPAPVSPPAPAPVESREPAAADKAAPDRLARLRAADAEVNAATQALSQAQAQLAGGKEPLPGERTGTAGGGSRLNEAYWARQADNEQAVAKAQARLDRAVQERNSVR
jgi:hypothetical protein